MSDSFPTAGRYSPPPFRDQVPPRPIRQTHTYTVLEIARSSFNDLKQRLLKADVLADYIMSNDVHGEVLVFGSIGFVQEKTPPASPIDRSFDSTD